jgi:hypothetical protein
LAFFAAINVAVIVAGEGAANEGIETGVTVMETGQN